MKSFQRPLVCWVRRARMLAAPLTLQCMPACLLGSLDDDGFDAALDGTGAGEHAQVAEVLVAHTVGVVAEVAEFCAPARRL
jgi:hypothetical protein